MNANKYTDAPQDIEEAMQNAVPVTKPYFMNSNIKPESILYTIRERWLEPLPEEENDLNLLIKERENNAQTDIIYLLSEVIRLRGAVSE